jgi:hypothetical protein
MSGDLAARRVALALLRLDESDDPAAVAALLTDLDAAEPRAVLAAQNRNVGLLFEAVFGDVGEARLPGVAAEFGRSRAQVIDDYLDRLIMRLALEEAEQA